LSYIIHKLFKDSSDDDDDDEWVDKTNEEPGKRFC